jgi:DNA-binding NtrC family response regulator
MERAGHRTIESGGYAQAQLLLSNGLSPDLILVESKPDRPAEMAQLRQLLKLAPASRTCLVTGAGEPAVRQEAAGLGIRHLLTKPVTRGNLELVLDELIPETQQSSGGVMAAGVETMPLPPAIPAHLPTVLHLEELGGNQFFLAASPRMLEIHRQAKMLANVDANVLILGESGTGKEVIAQLIHKHSRRSRYKFQKVNCAALPEDLLETELFGYRQGAFTGAVQDRAGKFEQADHSTLLLDEIGEIGSRTQAKFLQVLQDSQFTRVGGEGPIKVDVRVIAATNVDMGKALQQRTFREDLYYRLSVVTIQIPPLRERRMEIPFLIEETLRRAPAEMKNGSECRFSSRLMDAALLYDWRGNIRELRNFVTRTIVMRDQDAALDELQAKIAEAYPEKDRELPVAALADASDMRSIVRGLTERTEVRMIQEALDASHWNRRHAAKRLKISYRGLLYKIQQHRLAPNRGAEYSARSDLV